MSAAPPPTQDYEAQLHDDETVPVSKKRKNYDVATKLEAVFYAKEVSVHAASRKYNVDRKNIRLWVDQELELIRQREDTAGGAKRKRIDGAGRPVTHEDLDQSLAEWIRVMRENKQLVSRRIITNKAVEIFRGTELKVRYREDPVITHQRLLQISIGWLNKFLNRHNFVLRRRTTTCQKPPIDFAEAVARFVVHLEKRRKEVQFESYAMDETAVWFDCPDTRCIETRGAKEVK